MRPDEHKRKKNTQYKKKHGINEKAAKPDDRSSNKTTDEKSHHRDTETGHRGEKGQEGLGHGPVNASPASSNDAYETEGATASFRRREITSNWRKYEIESEDEDERFIQKRGTDFTQLLNHAGEAQSHFRLQDEVSWEDTSDVRDVLALDCDRLSEALGCIPMYELLNIDKDVLSEKQVEFMEQGAMKNMRNLLLKSNQQTVIDQVTSAPARADTNGEDKLCNSVKINNDRLEASENSPSSNVLNKLSFSLKNTGHNTSKNKFTYNAQGYNAKVVNTIHFNNAEDAIGNVKAELVEEDVELDFLLSLDKPHSKLDNVDQVNTDIGCASSITETKTEDNPQTNLPSAKDNIEIDTLEDWLDSVLDA